MPNINKVVYGNTTLIDLTDSTLNSADQLLQGVTAYDRSGTKLTGTATGGGTAAITIDDTTDSAGGTVRTITALDISDTTATASDVATGKYFYTANGTKTQGTATDSTFVVTISYNSTSQQWEPNKTFAEISAAYSAGKTIAVEVDETIALDVQVSGYYDSQDHIFYYFVAEYYVDGTITGTLYSDYWLDGNGLTKNGESTSYYTGDATISSNSQLLNGITAVGSDGTLYEGTIPTKTSSDLQANGATVTVPSGYYASQATKSVSTMSLPSAASSTSSGTSKATITPTASAQYLNIPTGYNDTAQYYTIAASGGTSKNTQVVQGTTRTNSSSMTAIGAEMTVSKTGTYDVYWSAFRNNTSSGYTWTSQLYVGGSAYGTGNTSFTNNQQNNHLTNVSLTANQKIRVYGSTTRGSSYYISAPTLVIVES